MSALVSVVDTAIREPRTQRLVQLSDLFESGALSDATSDESFVLRLNTHVASRHQSPGKTPPADLISAISDTGELHRHAELVAFGRWLLLDGCPGMKSQGGKQADPRLILQCVATAIHELRIRPALRTEEIETGARQHRKGEITKHDLATRWSRLFDQVVKPTAFDARLRSMRRILPAYLAYLRSGKFTVSGKEIRKSPEIAKVLKAISKASTPGVSQKTRTAAPVPHTPAVLAPFQIELRYSSSDREAEYRGLGASAVANPILPYLVTSSASTVASGRQRTDRSDKIVLKPDVIIRGAYKVDALVDRIAIFVDTVATTSVTALHDKISRATAAKTFVRDLTMVTPRDTWGATLPVADLHKKSGQHFAILIQDPNAELLTVILQAIERDFGTTGSIQVHMIEVAIDFYPKNTTSVQDAILRREQMVGLLQRHHWTPHSLLRDHCPSVPRYVDARQIYAEKEAPRYLFAQQGDSFHSDSEIEQPKVRHRILSSKTGKDIYLGRVDKRDSQAALNVIQAGICDGDQL
ncbi:cytochrome P450 family protein, partial [Ruegeria aquimaris]